MPQSCRIPSISPLSATVRFRAARAAALPSVLAACLSLTHCAATDEAVHRGHVRTGATVVGAGLGAVLGEKNRAAGGVVGAYAGNFVGGFFEQQYKSSKERNEQKVLNERRVKLQNQKAKRAAD